MPISQDFKNWVRRQFHTSSLPKRLSNIAVHYGNLRDSLEGFDLGSRWFEPNFEEPGVQLALRDQCRPGAVVYDVGANFARLSGIMSRLVGPSGQVYAFEASKRNLLTAQRNLYQNGCGNTQLYHAAVSSRSNETIRIYHGSHQGADSIYRRDESTATFDPVRTISLDDFATWSRTVPHLIKMDIEGAEWDALQGMPRLLADVKPHLILEHDMFSRVPGTHAECFALLKSMGYRALDLSMYRWIDGFDDYPPGVAITNVLYIHSDRLVESQYRQPFHLDAIGRWDTKDFRPTLDGIRTQRSIDISAGRYVCHVDFAPTSDGREIRCFVDLEGELHVGYQGSVQWISTSYAYWPFETPRDVNANILIESLSPGSMSSVEIRSIDVVKVREMTPNGFAWLA